MQVAPDDARHVFPNIVIFSDQVFPLVYAPPVLRTSLVQVILGKRLFPFKKTWSARFSVALLYVKRLIKTPTHLPRKEVKTSPLAICVVDPTFTLTADRPKEDCCERNVTPIPEHRLSIFAVVAPSKQFAAAPIFQDANPPKLAPPSPM